MSADRTTGDFGRTLREARERRGISLRQIANATKISMPALEALERNDVSRLPGGIFSRAFVRSYAVEVGLDPDRTVQEFIAQFPDSIAASHTRADQIEDHQSVESERRMASTFLALVAVSVPIAIAVLYFGVSGRQSDSDTSGAADASVATQESARPESREPVTSSTASQGASKSPATTTPATPATPATSGASGTAATAAPPAAASTETPARPAAPAVSPASGSPASPPPDGATQSFTIRLTVTKPCWVSATVDGRKAIDGLLQPGEQRSIEVRREMVLTAGDASAITMTVNGTAMRRLGKEGEVVTARLNPNTLKGYLQAR
jgi:cytoskeleton protein RodZ